MEVLSGLVTPAIANRSQDKRLVLAVLLVLIIAGFCGLILSPDRFSLLWPCLLGLGIGGLFPMSLIVSLDHLDNPRRAGGQIGTAHVRTPVTHAHLVCPLLLAKKTWKLAS